MSGKPLIGPDTTDVPISNTIRTIVKRRGVNAGVGEQRHWPIGRTRPRPPRRLPLPDPLVVDLLVFAFHRRPGDAEGGFLLARIVRMGGVGVIERRAKNVLRVLGQMPADRWRQVGVDFVGHGGLHGVTALALGEEGSRTMTKVNPEFRIDEVAAKLLDRNFGLSK